MADAYGIETKNTSGHLIISSEVPAFHFLGKAAKISSQNNNVSDFPDWSTDDGQKTLSGSWTHIYSIVVPGGGDILPFIRPGSNYAVSYGILQKYPNGPVLPGGLRLWLIVIVQRGHTRRPPEDVLCFYQLGNVKTPKDDYGLVTFLENGRVAFDAGRQPLLLKTNVGAYPPNFPLDEENYYPCYEACEEYFDKVRKLDRNFRTEKREFRFGNIARYGVSTRDWAFTAPSISQAVQNHAKYGWKSKNYIFYTEYRTRQANWWVFLVQTYRLYVRFGQQSFTAGWAPFRAGHYYRSRKKRSLGLPFLGLAITDTDTDTSGNQPYYSDVINWGLNNFMFIDASDYVDTRPQDITV